ncbi:protoheme IX farnesyltransferase [Pterulicium gracile]|uniref:Protoheme IX farnesyltransferase, mitochondrial n=1 Tax=Pterulicium gracile TaxID=1884261 RepID=A0A5C3QZD8_9AGAR|nr:protoheme IX farnesyltransferase [Pterula gracilis]
MWTRATVQTLQRCHHMRARHCRLTSTLTAPHFSSFFFQNSQWAPYNNPQPMSQLQSLSAGPLPTSDLTGYKEIARPRFKDRLKLYAQLSKARLTFLNVLTTMGCLALAPSPTTVPILLSTGLGTLLCSASANAFNQLQEVPFDAQMARTRTRPLVRRAISPLHAATFATVGGIAGPLILWTMVNPTTAILGAGNVLLYAGTYTWLKRRHPINTWVGSVVGAVPPLMGWTASGADLIPSAIHLNLPSFLTQVPSLPVESLVDNALSPFALFMLLFSWQFPHFNAFAHYARDAYAQAGYQMLSVLNPRKNALVSLRHTLLLVPICSVLFPLSGLTTWAFAVTSLIPNAIFVRAGWQFWKRRTEKEARTLFRHSLWYLPVVLAMAMAHKTGLKWREWLGMEDAVEEVTSVDQQS